MNNETKSTKSNGSSGAPLIIIGLVLVTAIIGGWWFYNNSKTKPAVTKANTNAANSTPVPGQQIPPNAPAGSSPANTLGPATAAVTIEEFADYQCPTCATVHTKMKEINSLYNGRVKFIYRSFPLTQIHKNAYEAAVAAEAAGMQSKYWAMQDQLYSNQQTWSNSGEARKIFEGYAAKIGLDAAKFQTDMAGFAAKARVDADLGRGRALNISGTPTLYINGNKLSNEQTDVNAMRQIIDAELQKASSQTTSNPPPTNSAAVQNNAVNAAAVNAANKK